MRIFYPFILFLFIAFNGFSQCGVAGNNQGVITPTMTSQNTGTVNSGRPYWTFTAVPGCTYTFSTCGLSSQDTYLTLYSGTGGTGTAVATNANACGNQSTIVWYCTVGGTYSIMITRTTVTFFVFFDHCNAMNGNVSMSYIRDNCTPPATDCLGATQVCSDVNFSGNSTGGGAVDLNGTNQGCLGVEHQSSWYYFQPVNSGTVELTITTGVDYDFAIWTGGCSNLGAPVRCSYAAGGGNTGLGNGAIDPTEDAGGNKWVAPLAVTAGQTYIMLIDNFVSSSTAFTLDWTFTGGATLNCNPIPLPLELAQFVAAYNKESHVNEIAWKTASERENDYFTLERSVDGVNWSVISKQSGAGDSYVELHYSYTDDAFETGLTNYYRLSQTDFNGVRKTLEVVSVNNTVEERQVLKVMNYIGQEVPFDTKGMVILLYNDGSSKRVYR